ncbi:hypothetical protein C5167_019294 [Papaver somniferum]|uniref:Glucosidase II beta subunit N-terminal domain-containing protein n=1 Tax=Papaver somniferum TaxID=3469 RepID=A0A4Y7IPQ9_PAPSO|nr:hypothetical protein C5167_019294 [Papaver somniferum]
MEMVLIFIPLLIISFFQSSSPSILPKSPYLGIHPEDEKYYFESQLIQCKDGSKSFTRDRLNDGFCDCVDGTDEPGNITPNPNVFLSSPLLSLLQEKYCHFF